jgi:dipeptidyl-peptidase-4
MFSTNTRLLLACGLAASIVAAGCSSSGSAPSGNQTTPAGPVSADDAQFLDAYARTFRYTLGRPRGFRPTPDGKKVLFLRSGPRSFVQDLYEFDVASGAERVLLTADQILGGGGENLSPEEKARRERMRMTSKGIAAFDLSDDGSKILAPLSGRLFIVDRETKSSREVRPTLRQDFPLDPQFSPDGTKIACVRAGDVIVHDLVSGAERQISPGAAGTISFGEAEFVAQEEMSRFHGYWWSPDGSRICYQGTDTAGLLQYHIADAVNPEKEPETWPYPKCGTTNARVWLEIVSLDGGAPVRVQWDSAKYPYLANVVWQKNAPLTILVQNREQTEQLLLAVADDGSTSTLLRENDAAWLNIMEKCPKWTADGKHFVWLSESSGEWTVELRRRDGSLVGPLTSPGSGVQNILHLDSLEGFVYVQASTDATQSHLWKVPLFAGVGTASKLTADRGIHGGDFAPGTGIWVHSFNTLDGKIGWNVRRADGGSVGSVISVAEPPPFAPNMELTQTGGNPVCHAAIFRPRNFDRSRTYPVILSVYAGPGVQTVKATGVAFHLQQWMADHGYIVVTIDGRGTPGRGRAWERAWKETDPTKRGNLIDVALNDQVAGLKALGDRYREMDLSRVGVTGWSFGGYFAAMAVMRRPDIFDAGIAGAPVCDFADYDTHYTERYLGLPSANPEGYAASNVLTYCKDLEKPLLIIHGTSDDNVYFQHSLKMTEALFKSGREFEFLPLAGFTHMVPDPVVTSNLQMRMMNFFDRNLK